MAATDRKQIKLPPELTRSAIHGPQTLHDSEATFHYATISQVRLAAGEIVGDSKSARQEVVDRVNAGELVDLDVDIRAFQQIDDEPNSNFLRFKKSLLRRFAKSFQGQPFLLDHNADSVEARAGTITKARAVAIDGGIGFDFTLRISMPGAVLGVMRRTLDRFSIGWAHGGIDTILCSHDGTPIFTECFHLPGDLIEGPEGEEPTRAEWIFTDVKGTEASAVSIPAVEGTGISEVRAALSQTAALCKSAATGTMVPEDDSMDLKKIAAKLGLAEDATEETILAAVDASQTATAEAGAELTALRSSQDEMRTELTALAVNDKQRTVDGLFVEFADRIPKARNDAGEPCAHPTEVELRKLAASDAAAARAILSTMPAVRPDGSLQSLPGEQQHASEDRPAGLAAGIPWDPVLASQLDALDISPEEYAAHGPHNGPVLSVKEILRQDRARRNVGGTRVVH